MSQFGVISNIFPQIMTLKCFFLFSVSKLSIDSLEMLFHFKKYLLAWNPRQTNLFLYLINSVTIIFIAWPTFSRFSFFLLLKDDQIKICLPLTFHWIWSLNVHLCFFSKLLSEKLLKALRPIQQQFSWKENFTHFLSVLFFLLAIMIITKNGCKHKKKKKKKWRTIGNKSLILETHHIADQIRKVDLWHLVMQCTVTSSSCDTVDMQMV